MARLPVLSWIGNAFAALCGKHGDVSAQAQAAACSRQTVYDHAHKVQHLLADAQPPGPSRGELLAENQRLLEDNRRLRQQLADTERDLAGAVVLSTATKHRLATATHAMGLSFEQIEEVFALLLRPARADAPARRGPDRSSIARWVRGYGKQAGAVLGVLDEYARPRAEVLAPDEIFFHGRPVLVGVEPFSMALLLCQRAPDRKGPTWLQALLPFTHLQYAIADQGSGLQAGLQALRGTRAARQRQTPAQAAAVPALENGLDVFHIEKEARPVLARLWRRVEARWERWEQAERRLARARDRRGRVQQAQAARRELERLWGWYERLEQGWRRAKAALAVWRPDGRLNDAAWARAELEAACKVLVGPAWAKVRRLLRDGRARTFLVRLQRQLAEAAPEARLREALVRLWSLERGGPSGPRLGACCVLRVACQRLGGEGWPGAYARVAAALAGVVRASSAVECVNSVLRMQQARHRNLTQEMLDLKRLYWNCRRFRAGKRQGKCPYQLLGVSLPTYDFWDLLQRDPAKLREELSTQGVAA